MNNASIGGRASPDGVFRPMMRGQVSQIRAFDLRSGTERIMFQTDKLVEAPNWHPDGERLVVNGWGGLFTVRIADRAVDPISVEGIDNVNNDHLLTRDGAGVLFSAGRSVYLVALEGGRPQRLTGDDDFAYYLHGLSPDGSELACTTVRSIDGAPHWGIALVSFAGGAPRLLMEGRQPVDGPEWSPDGEWLWFNGEIRAIEKGHSSLFRLHLASDALERMTSGERVDWFPHVTPCGGEVVYLSYAPATVGHPANRDVEIRIMDVANLENRVLTRFVGGQGSINVSSFAPDGLSFAYVAYPLEPSHGMPGIGRGS